MWMLLLRELTATLDDWRGLVHVTHQALFVLLIFWFGRSGGLFGFGFVEFLEVGEDFFDIVYGFETVRDLVVYE